MSEYMLWPWLALLILNLFLLFKFRQLSKLSKQRQVDLDGLIRLSFERQAELDLVQLQFEQLKRDLENPSDDWYPERFARFQQFYSAALRNKETVFTFEGKKYGLYEASDLIVRLEQEMRESYVPMHHPV